MLCARLRNCGIVRQARKRLATGFASGDHALCHLECCSIESSRFCSSGSGSKKSRVIR
jgi:hypothetical protein